MTETKEKEDLRDYYVVEHSIKHPSGEEIQKKMKVVLEFNKAESIKAVLAGFRDEVRPNVRIEDPYPLDMKKVLTKIKLNKKYRQDWHYVSKVLSGHWIKLPQRKKGEVGKYFITKELPSQEEFNALVTQHYTTSAESLFEEACDEIESLKDEVCEWKDNMEESFSHTDKYSELEECYDQLENFCKPDWPDELEAHDIKVVYIEPVPKIFRGRITQSRSSRLGEACAKLEAVTDALENFKTDFLDELRTLHEQLESKKEEIEEKASEVEDAERAAREIRDEWEQYETDKADYEQEKKDAEENGEEFDESAEPSEPETPLAEADDHEAEASQAEEDKDELEQNLTDWCEKNNVDPDVDPDDIESAIDSFIEEVNSGREEVEGVEFPGMYG